MAALGIPHEQMLVMLPSPNKGKKHPIEHISRNTLEKHYAQELARGAMKAHLQVANSFFRNCVGDEQTPGNVTAQIWYTKARLGWRDPEAGMRRAALEDEGQEQEADQTTNLQAARRIVFALELARKSLPHKK